jgi:anthranilate synthase/aminodeoxychorismate synthase-like glutamine amidotransferase
VFVIIDHRDSFVYNLAMYFKELGQDVEVVGENYSIGQLERTRKNGRLQGIILSPGPGSPASYGPSIEVVQTLAGKVPLLGICLGHQIIGHAYGACVGHGPRAMHGKITPIRHSGRHLFVGMPREYPVTRYHSLVVRSEGLPSCLEVDACDHEGVIMALRHKTLPVFGVQFHPEAVLTHHGHALLRNFISLCNAREDAPEGIREGTSHEYSR